MFDRVKGGPEEKTCEIWCVTELSEWGTRAPYSQRFSISKFRCSPDECSCDMAGVRRVTIVWTVQVRGHNTDEVSPKLLVVETALDSTHTLSVCIAFIRGVRRPFMQSVGLNGVACLVWVDASAQNADKLFDFSSMGEPDDVVIHGEVLLEEANFVIHVREEASYLGCEMDHIRRFDS